MSYKKGFFKGRTVDLKAIFSETKKGIKKEFGKDIAKKFQKL